MCFGVFCCLFFGGWGGSEQGEPGLRGGCAPLPRLGGCRASPPSPSGTGKGQPQRWALPNPCFFPSQKLSEENQEGACGLSWPLSALAWPPSDGKAIVGGEGSFGSVTPGFVPPEGKRSPSGNWEQWGPRERWPPSGLSCWSAAGTRAERQDKTQHFSGKRYKENSCATIGTSCFSTSLLKAQNNEAVSGVAEPRRGVLRRVKLNRGGCRVKSGFSVRPHARSVLLR